MSSTNHHGADDEFAEGGKVAAQRRGVSWVSKRQADITICRNYFKENGEYRERLRNMLEQIHRRMRGQHVK